jgi:hypothetical protein
MRTEPAGLPAPRRAASIAALGISATPLTAASFAHDSEYQSFWQARSRGQGGRGDVTSGRLG